MPYLALAGCVLTSACLAQPPNWTQLQPTTSPSGRDFHAMAFDPVRKHAVMFGGRSTSKLHNETWTWDGRNWKQLQPNTSPPIRYAHQMVWDSGRRRMVMFGGRQSAANTIRNDTWEWDGTNWTQIRTTTSPPVRCFHAMAYDSARRRTVLHGGSADGSRQSNRSDLWEYDGSNWTQVRASKPPSARHGHAMVYHAARQRTLLFGGDDGGKLLNDTWEWDGMTWTRPTLQLLPPGPRNFHALVWDTFRQRTVMYGGNNATDTWEYDGGNWLPMRTAMAPSTRPWISPMAYDPERRRTVFFGGWVRRHLNDTWEYEGLRTLVASPATISIASGGTHRFTLAAHTANGTRRYWIFGSLTGTSPGVTLSSGAGLLNVPLNPDFWTDITIGFANSAFLVQTRGRLDGRGQASASFVVPRITNPSAIGLTFHHAYLVYDAQNNYYLASNPATLTLTK